MESEQNHVPEGWISARIDDIVEVNPGKPPKDLIPADAPVSFVPMPAVDAEKGTITEPEIRQYHQVRNGYTAFRNEDLIVAKITPCMENGKAAIARDLVNGLGFGSSEFHVLRSQGAVLPDYLYHFVRQQSFRDNAAKQMTGSVGQKRVPADFIKTSIIPLPPLAEQCRIVERLEALLADAERVRGRLEGVVATMQRFRRAVLAAAVDGRLTTEWRQQNSHIGSAAELVEPPREMKGERTSQKRPIPTKWVWVNWPSVGSSQNGRAFPSKQYQDSGFKLLRPGNLHKEGMVVWNEDNTRCLPLSWAEQYPSYIVGPREIVMNLTAQSLKDDFLGRVCFTGENELCLLNQRIARLTPKKSEPKFIFMLFRSPQFREFVKGLNKGSLIEHMFVSQLDDFFFGLPPLPEQHEIVRRVDALFALADRIEGEVAGARDRVEALTQAILAKAFRGELVPTEAELARREGREYEPASMLLERVRAERQDGRPKSPARVRRPAGQSALPVE